MRQKICQEINCNCNRSKKRRKTTDWRRSKHSEKHQLGISGNVGRNQKKSGETDQGPINSTPAYPNELKLSGGPSNRGGFDKYRRHRKQPRGVRKKKQTKYAIIRSCKNSKRRSHWTIFSKLLDKSPLAELTTEDTWLDRLRQVIKRGDKEGFELIGPYTNPLWSQLAVQDDCILVNNRLAVPIQLRQAVLKRIHRGHLGQEAMLGVTQYQWWPHMHKDKVNLAEECRSCTRYGKNVKYPIPKKASKPLQLLTQPGQEVQLD